MAGKGDGSVVIMIEGDSSGLKKELDGIGEVAKAVGKTATAEGVAPKESPLHE